MAQCTDCCSCVRHVGPAVLLSCLWVEERIRSRIVKNPRIVLLTCMLGMDPVFAASVTAVDCYEPAPGGWRIRISRAADAVRLAPGSRIGVVAPNAAYSGDARLHRRPLYPPADRAMVYDDAERTKIERCGFRPLIVAYNEPRFLFDFHSAGGLLAQPRILRPSPA